jgi:Skp family chaperone for outer membrane proteins
VKKYAILPVLAAAMLAGCAKPSPIGLVDVNRIVANWPLYQNYQQQLLIDEQSIAQSRESDARKRAAALKLQAKYAGITNELTAEIRKAASTIAARKHLELVVTKEGVGYGGVDITPQVEKLMNITEKATPSPT